MSKDKYRVLWQELKRQDIDIPYLSKLTGITTASLYSRMRGGSPWHQSEMYDVMDVLRLPYDQLPVVFPRNGMYAGELQDGKTPTAAEKLGNALLEYLMDVQTKKRR